TVAAQEKAMRVSTASVRQDSGKRHLQGHTENVARLALDLGSWKAGEPLTVELDGQKLEKLAWPQNGALWLERTGGKWAGSALPGEATVRVARGVVRVGERAEKGDLACLFVRPRAHSDRALVGAVAGSSLAGMRLTERLPYFTSGVGYPDWLVLDAESLARG